MTKAERKMWFEYLQDLSKKKHKDYRQRVIQQFIVDFYIPDFKLIVEIDGDSHFTEQAEAYDVERSQILESLWCKIVRFTNQEIYENFDNVVKNLESMMFPLIKGEKTIEWN